MKIVYNRFIPFGRFTALTVLVWLFVKEGVGIRQAVHIEVEQGDAPLILVDDGEGGAGDGVFRQLPLGLL